jgi:hypothetical protein
MIETVEIPVAIAELIDKITILEIKNERLRDLSKLVNVRAELSFLVQRRDAILSATPLLDQLAARLKDTNSRIWDLEDTIRECDRRKDFGALFVDTAQKIYRANDERAAIKREINLFCGSVIIEEKSYAAY